MIKGLESLKYLRENKRKHWLDSDKSDECLDVIEEELKALEIIKENFFTFIEFKEEKRGTKTYYLIDFNRGDYKVYLSKEKWNLLKEVLL